MRRARSSSAGFTLFEILLALGVLSILVALSWPSVLRLYGEQKLISAAEKARSLIASARVHAIESGLVYQFRYEPKGNHFLVVPFEREFEGADPKTRSTGAESGVGQFSKLGGNLPEGIEFRDANVPRSDTSTNTGQQISSDALSGLPNADKLSGVTWSGPLLFQPDGSAADAEVILVDRHSQRVTLRVRGITGAVSVSRLQQDDHP
jgi:prepilin-type N-terminal cleavage/methylation domain-containing protein